MRKSVICRKWTVCEYRTPGILGNRELIDQLKVEKFDAALFATLDVCGLRRKIEQFNQFFNQSRQISDIVNAIGVDNYAFIDLHSTLPASFHYTAVPESLSYVPGAIFTSTKPFPLWIYNSETFFEFSSCNNFNSDFRPIRAANGHDITWKSVQQFRHAYCHRERLPLSE